MAQFTLTWDNTFVLASSNSTAQRALYRGKTAGGAFITTGFTPSNDMAKSVTSAISPVLSSNLVYEFKVQTICSQNGPTDNDNGVREIIDFTCITPTLTKNETTGTATLNVTGTDISAARFTLKRASDNTIVYGPTVVNRSVNSIAATATGLTGTTNYYWQIELYSTINLVEAISSQPQFLGSVCGPYTFTTDASPVCNPVTSITVTSVEIP